MAILGGPGGRDVRWPLGVEGSPELITSRKDDIRPPITRNRILMITGVLLSDSSILGRITHS